MRLKIKVKHLFAIAVALCASVLFLQAFVMPRIEIAMAKKHFEQGTPDGKEELIRVLDASSGNDKWALIRDYMIENGSDLSLIRFDVIAGDGTYQSSTTTSFPNAPRWTGEEKIKYLEAYIEGGPIDGYYVRAAKQLAYEYVTRSRTEDAVRVLERTEQKLPGHVEDQGRELKLARARIYADAGQLDAAERLLTELSGTPQPRNTYLNGNIAALQARITAQRQESASSVSGAVTRSDGTPMAGIGVYLRSSRDVYHSLIESEPYQTLTDSEGKFAFKGVAPGSYALYIGLNFEQIDGWTLPASHDEEWIDLRGGEHLTRNMTLQRLIQLRSPVDQQVITGKTVTFEWEPVEGAAYYTLNGTFPIENGTVGHTIKDHIRSHSIELPIETLYSVVSGYSYKKFGDKQIPDPSNLLGYADPSSRFSWSVEARDADGKLLTRSDGYRLNEQTMGPLPFFYLKEHTLTEPDRLLLEGRTDEALQEYKANYERNGQDSHSLRMIVKLLEISAFIDKRPLDAASLPYLVKLANTDPTGNALPSLISYYGSIGEWAQADRYYGMLNEARQGKVESYPQAQYGRLLLKQGRVREGEEQLRQAQANDPSNRFIGDYIASVIYLSAALDKAEELALLYPERSYYDSSNPDWSKLVRGLKEESEDSNDKTYFDALKEALLVCFSEDKKRIEDWMSEAKFPAMKAFISAVSDVD
ncbi:carboxypeptidase regulatory-like domain-containing protein [Cohnella sp. AR92]|uniref:carboxypeptidase regulatory-like domain-containing protein n=1 Tax=Cohnella sp. AR92 TaxID=648716 RepID=UPI001315610A|nr:carboxypeptidase regulatory-like domain-containing protein [Cohnella sp. AR92]